MFNSTLNFIGLARIATFVTIIAMSVVIYLQNDRLENLKIKNSNLKETLKQCKTENEAKDFENKWSNEFYKTYKDLEDIGIEDENKTNDFNYNTITF